MGRAAAGWPVMAAMLVPAVAGAQYVGKVGQGAAATKPVLRATAVYEYTGSMVKPTASRLVPVVVWDGERYQPGALYLARPEPLAVAPGTQYQLEQDGVPGGLFDIGSAAQLNGAWIGLGRYAAAAPPAAPKKLAAAKKLPTLSGGSGRGRAEDAGSGESTGGSGGPVLHKKGDVGSGTATGTGTSSGSGGSGAGSGSGSGTGTGTSSGGSGSASGTPDPDRPTLHRRDDSSGAGSGSGAGTGTGTGTGGTQPQAGGASGTGSNTGSGTGSGTGSSTSSGSSSGSGQGTSSGTTQGSSGGSGSGRDDGGNGPVLHRRDDAGGSSGSGSSPAPDPDRPTLHRAGGDQAGSASAPDPDRPVLHKHADTGETVSTPDPDRPHLRYGVPADAEGRVQPVELKELPAAGGVPVGRVVAVSDTLEDEAHPYRFAFASTAAEDSARAACHGLALAALLQSAQATFGPAAARGAKTTEALRRAAAQNGSFGPGAGRGLATGASAEKAGATSKAAGGGKGAASGKGAAADPLVDVEFHAFELSYGGSATYVYTAHTEGDTPTDRRYVTVIAQPDFYGKAHAVWTQTTRGDTLGQTPALQLVDAVDADGDHRAELLFAQESAAAGGTPGTTQAAGTQFSLYSVGAGTAQLVFSSSTAAGQL